MSIAFHLIEGNDETAVDNVVAFNPFGDKPLLQADSNHPHWTKIIEGLKSGDESVFELFDVQGGVVKQLTQVSDRISFDGSNILFDGDPQEGPLAEHLFRCIDTGVRDYAPVAKFWEKVAQNPDERSREQLFTWLRSHDFTITDEGDILGYKGVVGYDESQFRSSHSGKAFVDGVEHNGQIPNKPGTEVTMPRSAVANDPNVACHYGLHVGDWSYASTFAQTVLEVHVNPRDVVSIPRDHSHKKMRCCRYKVVKVRSAQSQKAIDFGEEEPAWEDVGYVAGY